MQTFEKQLCWKEQDIADHFLHVAVPPRFEVFAETSNHDSLQVLEVVVILKSYATDHRSFRPTKL